jgi:anti-sigma-K factor RskA
MNDDVHSLGGLYSLDALDDLERQRFERHAESCADCQGEVAEFHQTMSRIAADDAEPAPAAMRAQVLNQIAVTPQMAVPATASPSAKRSWVVTGMLAAASVVLIAALGFALVRSRAQLSESRDLAAELVDPRNDSLTYAGSDGVVARVVSSPDKDFLVVSLSGLKPVANDRAYELWMINGDGPTAMGVVRPSTDGSARFVIEQEFDQFTQFGITEEAAGGSPVPTSDVLISGDLQA